MVRTTLLSLALVMSLGCDESPSEPEPSEPAAEPTAAEPTAAEPAAAEPAAAEPAAEEPAAAEPAADENAEVVESAEVADDEPVTRGSERLLAVARLLAITAKENPDGFAHGRVSRTEIDTRRQDFTAVRVTLTGPSVPASRVYLVNGDHQDAIVVFGLDPAHAYRIGDAAEALPLQSVLGGVAQRQRWFVRFSQGEAGSAECAGGGSCFVIDPVLGGWEARVEEASSAPCPGRLLGDSGPRNAVKHLRYADDCHEVRARSTIAFSFTYDDSEDEDSLPASRLRFRWRTVDDVTYVYTYVPYGNVYYLSALGDFGARRHKYTLRATSEFGHSGEYLPEEAIGPGISSDGAIGLVVHAGPAMYTSTGPRALRWDPSVRRVASLYAASDFERAEELGLTRATPDGWFWHSVEDGQVKPL